MPDEKDKWKDFRGSGDPDKYKKAQEDIMRGINDNPIMNAYEYLMGDKKKKPKEDE